jgi:nicotinate-nucleotide adenylyltransferase
VNGLFGGAFDPPHNGHLGLLRAGRQALGLAEVLVLVAGAPGHKSIETPAAVRLELARAAFPGETVLLDLEPRTIDMLRSHPERQGTVFLLGADEFADLASWKEPEELLRLVRLGVATRPGYPRERRLEGIATEPMVSERVWFFDLEPMPIASRELRARLDRGEDVHEFVPAAVWEIIERDRLYGRGYTGRG